MPSTDQEVFRHLQQDPDTRVELDLLTYAIYAYEKYEWIAYRETELQQPTPLADVDNWIREIPPHRFDAMRRQAEDVFDRAAREYLETEIKQRVDDAIKQSIVAEVKAAGAFWKQLATAMITAILAPLIIGAVIAAWLAYDRYYPTATEASRASASATRQQPTSPPGQSADPSAGPGR